MPQSTRPAQGDIATSEAAERVILHRQLEGHCFGNQPPCPAWTMGGPPLPNPGKVHDPRKIRPRSSDARSGAPRTTDPRTTDPRATDPRSTDPRSTDEAEWLWDGKIPLGEITVIAGLTGVGKSFLAADLCARATAGISFPPTRIAERDVFSSFYWEMAAVRHRVALAHSAAGEPVSQPPRSSPAERLTEPSTTVPVGTPPDQRAGGTPATPAAALGGADGVSTEIDVSSSCVTPGQPPTQPERQVCPTEPGDGPPASRSAGGRDTAATEAGGRDHAGEITGSRSGTAGNTRDPKSGSGDQRSSHGLRALVIAGESHPTRQMARRVQQCGGDLERLRILDQVQIFYDTGPAERRPIQFPADFDLLWPEVSRLSEGGLLVIESLAHCLAGWREREIRTLLRGLNELARQRQIAVVVLTGLKSDPRAKLDQRREENWDLGRALGSRALAELPASIWQLRTNTAAMLSRGGPRELLPLKTRLTKLPLGYAFRLQDDSVDWLPVEIPTFSYDWWQTEIGALVNAQYREVYGKDQPELHQMAEEAERRREERLGSSEDVVEPDVNSPPIPPGIIEALQRFALERIAQMRQAAPQEDSEQSPEVAGMDVNARKMTELEETTQEGLGREPQAAMSTAKEPADKQPADQQSRGLQLGDESVDRAAPSPAGESTETVTEAAGSLAAITPHNPVDHRPTVFPSNPLSDRVAPRTSLLADDELATDTEADPFAHLDGEEGETEDASAVDSSHGQGAAASVRPQPNRTISCRISRRKARRLGKLRR